MARAAWLFVKWLVIPIALACAGYYVVGPRVSQYMPEAIQPQRSAPVASQPASRAHEDTAAYPTPDVSVSQRTGDDTPPVPKRHHKRKAKPADQVPAPDQGPPPDQGGSGGAATTGGNDAGGSGGGGGTGGTDGL